MGLADYGIENGKKSEKGENLIMAKKVLIISTSLRRGSNSDILANECAKGAKEAGHDVELLSLKGKDIKYCIGCLSCQKTGRCVLKDDVADIMASKGCRGHCLCNTNLLL